ncbi:MAG TPA: helix-turn-helix domain-containing protein [Candidatus Saccharimonadales bacterium]|nr:helix-turn-helix domain-containing protein [Candidatus Saccharimonadales bacterium]
MSDNNDKIVRMMKQYGLSSAEAVIYIELLSGPSTHLKLSRRTGITRSRVYHVVELLEKRGLAVKFMDDTGSFVKASDPNNFEIELTAQEQKLKERRELLNELIPELLSVQKNDSGLFSVKAYEGESGFRQMAWHELKAKNEILCFGYAEVEVLINDHRWSELHRQMTVEAGYKIREIVNYDSKSSIRSFTANDEYLKRYECRAIPKETVSLSNQIVIYNNVVNTYHWREGVQIGVEIISDSYSQTMRAVFEQFWGLAEPVEITKE